MSNKSGRIGGLTIAFILIVLALVAIIIIDARKKAAQKFIAEPIKREMPVSFKSQEMLQAEDIKKETESDEILELKKEEHQAIKLKDLPIEEILLKKEDLKKKDLQTEKKVLKIQPTSEEIKILKEKGAVIY